MIKARYLFWYLFFICAFALESAIPRVGPFRGGLIFFLIISALLFVSVAIRKRLHLNFWQRYGFMTGCYIALCFLSALWSVSPIDTLLYSALLLWLFVFSSNVQLLDGDCDEFIYCVVNGLVYLAVVCWFFVIFFPGSALSEKGVAWRLQGVIGHEQRLALFMGIGLILSFALNFSKSTYRISYLTLLFLAVTLIATQARANTFFVFVVVFCIYLFEIRKSKVLAMVAALVFALLALLTFYFLVESGASITRGEADYTLTGRTSIWGYVIAEAALKPLLGHGYSSFFSSGFGELIFQQYQVPHAHNTFVQVYFENGLLGLLVMSLMVAGLIRVGKYSRYVVIYSILAGMMGVVFGEKLNGVLLLVLLVIAIESKSQGRWLEPRVAGG